VCLSHLVLLNALLLPPFLALGGYRVGRRVLRFALRYSLYESGYIGST
jgi:hypothetical protein